MNTVIIDDMPKPEARTKRTTIIEEQEPAPKGDVVINVGEGSTVIIPDDEED